MEKRSEGKGGLERSHWTTGEMSPTHNKQNDGRVSTTKKYPSRREDQEENKIPVKSCSSSLLTSLTLLLKKARHVVLGGKRRDSCAREMPSETEREKREMQPL